MFNRDDVTSGFDIELLASERALRYAALAQIEAGRLPTRFDVVNEDAGIDLSVFLHPPTDYARRYEPAPEAPPLPQAFDGTMTIELLPEDAGAFAQIDVFVTVEDRAGGRTFRELAAGLLVDVALTAEEADNGLETTHELAISLVRFDDQTRTLLALFGDPDALEDQVRPFFERRIPLGIARGGLVQRIRLRRFADGPTRSLAVYLDLALRAGPEPDNYVAPRGDVASGRNFRRAETEVAFATSPSLFALLGPDLKFRLAEPDDSGGFRFPLRSNLFDPDSDEFGRVKSVAVGPRLRQAGDGDPGEPTGELQVRVKAEITDAPGDPDVTLFLNLRPEIDDGVVSLDVDVNVEAGPLATLLLTIIGIGLGLLFGPIVGWGTAILAGAIFGVAVIRGFIAPEVAAKILEDRIDDADEASLLDALPFRLPAARRRWDPFYVTEHQVVPRIESVVVDRRGIALEATDVVLDREPQPVPHVVIRDVQRSISRITAVRYRVRDFNARAADFAALAPGTDRRSFVRAGPDGEPTLVDLDRDEILARIEEGRLLAPITMVAERIHLVHNQIDHILSLSRRERAEARDRVIRRFRNERRAALLAVLGPSLDRAARIELEAELGRPPTDEEITAFIDAFLAPVLDQLVSLFLETKDFEERLDAEKALLFRLELLPEQMVELQRDGMLFLDGKEIIERRLEGGGTRPYYRDRPDGIRSDNLLEVKTYIPPFVPQE